MANQQNVKKADFAKTAEDNRNIYHRLSDAREAFHQLELKKSGWNDYSEYHYFELADFLVPAMKCLKNEGLTTLPVTFTKDEARLRVVDMAAGSTLDITSPMSTAHLKACHEVQNLGAVQTYLRRYLWVSLMEVLEHEALDGAPPASIDADQLGQLNDWIKDGLIDKKRLLKAVSDHVAEEVTELGQIPAERFDWIESMVKARLKLREKENKKKTENKKELEEGS